MNILILGGTRFFGRELVKSALAKEWRVTVATRGTSAAPRAEGCHYEKAERGSQDDLDRLGRLGPFDAVVDQIGFCSNDAGRLLRAFKGHAKRIIFTSSASVYGADPKLGSATNAHEEEFLAERHPVRWGERGQFDYADGKRAAEAVLAQQSDIPTASVRFPVVAGIDDPTGRFKFHVDRISNGLPIYFPNPDARLSLIEQSDAGEFLSWLCERQFQGAVNAASAAAWPLNRLMAEIESACAGRFLRAAKPDSSNASPYGVMEDFFIDCTKAARIGFSFKAQNAYIPELARRFRAMAGPP